MFCKVHLASDFFSSRWSNFRKNSFARFNPGHYTIPLHQDLGKVFVELGWNILIHKRKKKKKCLKAIIKIFYTCHFHINISIIRFKTCCIGFVEGGEIQESQKCYFNDKQSPAEPYSSYGLQQKTPLTPTSEIPLLFLLLQTPVIYTLNMVQLAFCFHN